MESLPSEMKKLVSYFAGYLATSIDLIRAATLLSAQDLKFVHDDDKRLPVLIQIGQRMIGRTEILSSASLSDSMQDVAVERDSVLALSDYVVLLKVNGDEIDLQIITEGSSLRSLPIEPLSIDLIVCVFGSSDSLAVQMLKEFKRVLKLESEIFLIQTEQSTSLHLVINLEMAGLRFEDVQIGSKKSGFGYGFEDLRIGSLKSLQQTESFQIFKIKEKVSDLIDEDTLISEEDRKRPEYPPVPDPAVGSNTCEWLGEEPLQHCRLGDAFRCRTCPYRGCPGFELGEKVTPNFPPPED